MTGPLVDAGWARIAAWKARSPTLTDEARVPAPRHPDGRPTGCHPFCLPATYAACNLLPEVREAALQYFARGAIVPSHA